MTHEYKSLFIRSSIGLKAYSECPELRWAPAELSVIGDLWEMLCMLLDHPHAIMYYLNNILKSPLGQILRWYN